MKTSLFLATALVTTLASAQSSSLPSAPGAKVANITPKSGYFNEPAIAINPHNPQQLVAAYQVNATVAYSENGGKSWKRAEGTAPSEYRRSGDVSIAFDAKGAAILCFIAFDKLGTTYYWAHNATRNGVFIRRSPDGGKNWEKEFHAVIAHQDQPGNVFEDKPYIFADNTSSRHAGNLYVGWTQFTLTKSVILFSRSTDGGNTWSEPIEISTHEGLPRDDNGSDEGFAGAVGADGTVYVAWADANTIAFTSSSDGGKTFAPSRSVIETAPPYFPVPGIERGDGFPQIGADQQHGTLYLTWSDYRNGDIDVFAATSSDQGATWGKAVRVNSDEVHNGTDQFLQWMAVDPVTGAANVVFYDRRADPANQKTTITLARSVDGGKSFINYALSSEAFTGNEDFIGDYTGVAAYRDHVFAIWAAEASGKKKRHNTVVQVGSADFSPQK